MATARPAAAPDSPILARMLHDFNTEFGDPSPGVEVLSGRVAKFIAADVKAYLLGAEQAGGEPVGFAQISFNPTIWSERPIAHLDELYVVPACRGRGVGRALMEAFVALAREHGAPRAEVVTGEDDSAARALYERFGFANEVEGPDNSRSLFYELDLE